MNKMTLKQLYPHNIRVDKALTAVQLISMHLFIWRPKHEEDSADPFFGPYISILPRDFSSHPLTWLVLAKLSKADDLRVSLLDSLPPSVLAALHRLHTRFWDDWCKVRSFLVSIYTIFPVHRTIQAHRDIEKNAFYITHSSNVIEQSRGTRCSHGLFVGLAQW